MHFLIRKLNNRSIREKLIYIILAGIITAAAFSSIALIIFDRSTHKNAIVKELQVLAKVVGQRSGAAIAFEDRRVTKQNLESLNINPAILSACIFNKEKKLFTESYGRKNMRRCPSSLDTSQMIRYTDTSIEVIEEIVFKQKTMGYIFLLTNYDRLTDRTIHFALTALFYAAISSFIAYFLTTVLQRSITRPIAELSKVATTIKDHGDFSIRAEKISDDEVGSLVESFNNMLSHTQQTHIDMLQLVEELEEKTDKSASQTLVEKSRNETIRSFFASASHDLRQPIQAMAIFSDNLYHICNEEQKSIVKKLILAIDNLSQLFTDLLDVSKLESRLGQVQKTEVAIQPLLEKVFHEFEVIAADKDLQLRFRVGDYAVSSHATMLERIIRNLLSNAIRYTYTGGILLTTRRRGDSLLIEVWDTGRGIPKEKLHTIFEQFVQVDENNRSSQAGFGLGLAIVKRLAELLEHPISMDSKEGKGTVFRIELPLSENTPPSLAIPSDAVVVDISPLKNLTVLLIDDEDMIRDGLKKMIEDWEMTVISAASISEAAGYFSSGEYIVPDVIISDYQLGDNDTGVQAIKLIRGLIGTDIPALIVTGNSNEENISHIKNNGLQFLLKPIKPAKLRALINYSISLKN